MTIKSGIVSIIGQPNVGKSTLLNTVINNKIAIVTAKAQTTRNRIQGIYNDKKTQIVFIDTPGIHKAHNEMEKIMNKITLSAIKTADIILFLISANKQMGYNDYYIIKTLQKRKIPIILIITKIDLIPKDDLIIKIIELEKKHTFTTIIPISAIKYKNIEMLLTLLKKYLKEGPQYYSNNILTDQSEKFLICEIIREKILLLTKDEIPHSVAILINKIENQSKLLKIIASICVERYSQKKIIIGKNGLFIKKIGIQARLELEQILGIKIFLELFVKVIYKWRNRPSIITQLGYNEKKY